MLGTFPYELWFKSYRCFTVGSLEFLEIANLSLFPSPTSLLCFSSPATDSAAADAFPAFPAINSSRAGTHASRTTSSPSCCLALEPPQPSHAPRRFQSHPGGRHRDVAVESPNQRPSSRSFARLSTTRIPGFDFTHPFALSPRPDPRTRRRSTVNADELHPAAEPPTQTRSTPTSPTISTASTSRSS